MYYESMKELVVLTSTGDENDLGWLREVALSGVRRGVDVSMNSRSEVISGIERGSCHVVW